MAIIIHVIVFIHWLQLMKMTEENENEGDTLRVNHTGENNITTNTVTFLPSVTHTSTRNTVTTQTVTTHTATRNTCPVQTAISNISTAEIAADADTLTQGAHSVVTGLLKSAFASILVRPCKIYVSLK